MSKDSELIVGKVYETSLNTRDARTIYIGKNIQRTGRTFIHPYNIILRNSKGAPECWVFDEGYSLHEGILTITDGVEEYLPNAQTSYLDERLKGVGL
jgi:hypothetical protein